MAKSSPTIGRPTKLTPALHDAIVQAVSRGLSPIKAAVLAGIDESTVLEWLARGDGRDPDRPQTPLYASFADAVKRAWIADEQRRIQKITDVGNGGAIVQEKIVTLPDGTQIKEVKRAAPQFQAHAWMLERTRRDDYALRSYQTTTHDISDAMAALIQQWQQLRDAPPPLPPHQDALEAEITPIQDITRPDHDPTFALLDRLNDQGEDADA
jgi:hypothetical protein